MRSRPTQRFTWSVPGSTAGKHYVSRINDDVITLKITYATIAALRRRKNASFADSYE